MPGRHGGFLSLLPLIAKFTHGGHAADKQSAFSSGNRSRLLTVRRSRDTKRFGLTEIRDRKRRPSQRQRPDFQELLTAAALGDKDALGRLLAHLLKPDEYRLVMWYRTLDEAQKAGMRALAEGFALRDATGPVVMADFQQPAGQMQRH
jgi:hypothetical protein